MVTNPPEILHVAREVVRVSGADATAYLQSQLSQNVEALSTGAAARSFLLAPTGHVVGWFRIVALTGDEYLLETDPGVGAGEAIVERLERFRLRSDVSATVEAWQSTMVFGSDAAAVAASLGRDDAVATEVAAVCPEIDWPGMVGVESLVPGSGAPVPDDRGRSEAVRISSGVPRAGVDFAVDGTTIPAELGAWVIKSSVDFTKGCYTGQELVARVDSRGNHVPRPLRLLRLDEVPAPGAEIRFEGKEAGRVTSSASLAPGGAVALAVIARRVEVPSEVTVHWDGHEATAGVEPLPGSDD